MNERDFFESEIHGLPWGMFHMPEVPVVKTEPKQVKKKFELFPWPHMRVDV